MPDLTTELDTCRVDFPITSLRPPAIDSYPTLEGMQTNQVGYLMVHHGDGRSSMYADLVADGMDLPVILATDEFYARQGSTNTAFDEHRVRRHSHSTTADQHSLIRWARGDLNSGRRSVDRC
ncbi:MAG: hypothetical protein ACRD12_21260 [Acidimicrobiales bacterium]